MVGNFSKHDSMIHFLSALHVVDLVACQPTVWVAMVLKIKFSKSKTINRFAFCDNSALLVGKGDALAAGDVNQISLRLCNIDGAFCALRFLSLACNRESTADSPLLPFAAIFRADMHFTRRRCTRHWHWFSRDVWDGRERFESTKLLWSRAVSRRLMIGFRFYFNNFLLFTFFDANSTRIVKVSWIFWSSVVVDDSSGILSCFLQLATSMVPVVLRSSFVRPPSGWNKHREL